jgi:hypothetical protein
LRQLSSMERQKLLVQGNFRLQGVVVHSIRFLLEWNAPPSVAGRCHMN